MPLSSSEIRQRFLRYFETQGHRVVKSSALVPHNDPTLLFTNAGMVQFKDLFTGKEKRDYSRATTSQKCLRAGGKHNDLENVGVTARHHTFFEMLGNFSFGDYFKQDAIKFAWHFVTKDLGLDVSRLCVTVFKGENGVPGDDEAAQLWEAQGVPKERIFRLGAKDNFWAMGDTGPCGPCSELHFYQGELDGQAALKIFDTPAAEDQWIEIWNLVFMQFERFADGKLQALPKPSIDTGAGLERVTAVANGLKSNYDTDLLLPLIEKAATLCQKTYTRSQQPDDVSLRVLADHARATAFLIADGVFPSNDGRGYVLRRIMRRAIRHGERLGLDEVFFFHITDEVVQRMGAQYPELAESRTAIERWVKNEEEGFRRTLRTGLRLLNQRIEKNKGLSGEDAFELYDTYGFPLDLTEVIAREKNVTVDHDGFNKALDAQRARAGAFKNEDKAVADVYKKIALEAGQTRFLGYDLKEVDKSGHWVMHSALPGFTEIADEGFVRVTIKALVQQGKQVSEGSGDIDVVVDPTPFYGESGGQIGDRHGVLADMHGHTVAEVKNTLKPAEGFHVSEVHASAPLHVGQEVLARYDAKKRHETRAHHSATHLLHKALRDTLGDHVKQAGSLVGPDRLRFDFSHFEALTSEQIDAIEAHVHQRVLERKPVQTDVLSFDDAKKAGAVALFGEKYGDEVRVLSIGDSKELCGGTHAFNTGDIGTLRITKEEAIAAGVRRIEAVVSESAQKLDEEREKQIAHFAEALGGGRDGDWLTTLVEKVNDARKTLGESGPFLAQVERFTVPANERRGYLRFIQALRTAKPAQRAELLTQPFGKYPLSQAIHAWLTEAERLDKRLAEGKASQAGEVAAALAKEARAVHSVKLVASVLDNVEPKDLRTYAERVRDHLGSGVVALATVADGKASLVVVISKDLTTRFKAGDIVKALAAKIGGNGGGKPDFAQAGGPNVAALPDALASLSGLLG